jgi:hypothetical protein
VDLSALVADTLAHATGRVRRSDAVRPRTGGPAGNARLTAWTGLALLVLFAAELVTLLSVRRLIDWHVAVGVLLVPPALVKTASTGWRIVRYYTGDRSYRVAGPPPLPLRVLGPLVVLATLAVLGSGLLLVAIGPQASRHAVVTVLGRPVDAVNLHKVTFLGWAAVTGVHTLGRLLPALRLTVGGPRTSVPGRRWRAAALVAAAVAAAVGAVAVLGATDTAGWRTERHRVERHYR